MKRISVLSISLVAVLQAGASLAADCAAISADSLLRAECERSQKGLVARGELPVQVMGERGSQQAEAGRDHPWARVDTPPLRKQGAEPLITVFLTSGSTIRVDKTWVRGDRLFYFSRGVGGSVPLIAVNRLEDLRHKLRTDPGR
jgi:hypothetical protein